MSEDLKKKLENFWYYYKIPVIIAVAVLLLVVDTIINLKPEEKYDHSIAMISTVFPPEEELDVITQLYSDKYGGTFELRIYNIELGALNQDEATIAKVDIDLGHKISEYLLIEDLDAFKKATNDLEIHEVTLVSDLDWLVGHGIDNLYFAKR